MRCQIIVTLGSETDFAHAVSHFSLAALAERLERVEVTRSSCSEDVLWRVFQGDRRRRGRKLDGRDDE